MCCVCPYSLPTMAEACQLVPLWSMMRTCTWGCGLLLLAVTLPHNEATGISSSPWLLEAITALDKALDFFENNYDRIILDGIYGLRVAEGKNTNYTNNTICLGHLRKFGQHGISLSWIIFHLICRYRYSKSFVDIDTIVDILCPGDFLSDGTQVYISNIH